MAVTRLYRLVWKSTKSKEKQYEDDNLYGELTIDSVVDMYNNANQNRRYSKEYSHSVDEDSNTLED